MARRVLKKRSTANDEDARKYAEQRDTPLGVEHLSEETRARIPDLDDLMELRQRMQVDRLRGAELKAEYD
jgi:hypothetical protein